MLRDYQQRTIDELYHWLQSNDGNPCIELPTGSGKSHIVAALCKDAVGQWPDTRVLMLTHVKELIEQNAEKMRLHWPGAPMGIYSAGIGKRQLDEPITFAGIQSVRNKADLIGHIDLLIIDECHLVSHKNEGGYRKLIDDLKKINHRLRVIGLTATPYRLGHGMITDNPAIFDDIIKPVSIEELIHNQYLAPLRSKITDTKLDTDSVHKRGGEYIESELQAAVDTDDYNNSIVTEVIERAGDRKSWLFFCTGVEHAYHIRDVLSHKGISAECITGKTPKDERNTIINRFKSGEVTALTNANVLTTGFDHPDIDLIAMLRPTMSPSLYVQMAGRGMRTKTHTDHCLVLDFAGVVEQHGAITAVQPPPKRGNAGEAPIKACPECGEIVHASVKNCPECNFEFESVDIEKSDLYLRDDDIMGIDCMEMEITSWSWRVHTSKRSGKIMPAVTYYGALSDPPINEYFPIFNGGYAAGKAIDRLFNRTIDRGLVRYSQLSKLTELEWSTMTVNDINNDAQPPALIKYRKNGKFYDVKEVIWND